MQQITTNMFTMKKFINTIITDINHVIVKGDSDKVEQARIFILLAIPAMIILFSFGRSPGY
jgi:hypothetical protein